MVDFPTRQPPKQRLLLFARVPIQGEVKSRLARDLGEEAAHSVYAAMLQDILDSLRQLPDSIECEVMWTAASPVDGATLRETFGTFPLAMQTGETLSERLSVAFSERFFFHGTEKVVAIGVDEPTLGTHIIEQAFALLDSCEWVLGPAADGGYYLIGCRSGAFRASIFRDIPWGTDEVFRATSSRVREAAATMAVLPLRMDIDEKKDLEQLVRDRVTLPRHLAEVAEEMGLRP